MRRGNRAGGRSAAVMKRTVFRGSGVALVTPMRQDFSVDYEALGRLVDFHLARKTDALVVVGTTGEAATLSPEERLGVISFCRQRTGGILPVVAGAGGNCTREAAEFSKRAEAAGADALLHVTPYYNKPSQEGLYRHFMEMSRAVRIPIILYNVPSRTGVNLSADTCRRLAEQENIVAVKEAGGSLSQVADIRRACGSLLDIYSGNDDQITAVLALGGKGVISVLANLIPEEVHRICYSFFRGDAALSEREQIYWLPLIRALFRESNPAPVKEAMRLAGMDAGPCRLPLCELGAAAREELRRAMEERGLLAQENA